MIVASQRGAQQPVGVQRRGGHHHMKPGDVGEQDLPRLAVIERPSLQISARRHPQDHRAGVGAVGAPAHRRELVPDLHHGRPDVVEELDLHDRLQTARRHTDGPADDARLGQGAVENPLGPEAALQVVGHLEDAPLPLDLSQVILPGAVGHVLSEDDDA
jgi:hypothetical protein